MNQTQIKIMQEQAFAALLGGLRILRPDRIFIGEK